MQHEQPSSESDFSFISFFKTLTTSKVLHTIIILGLIVFANMLVNQFVWDDLTYVLPNASTYGLDIGALLSPNYFNSYGYYRPIPAFYFSFIHLFAQDAPFFYHLVQLALHITSTVLLYFLFAKAMHKHIALLISLIFLVHPMQIESVSFIAQAGNVISFLFGLLALRYASLEKKLEKKTVLIFFFFLLALLTKESAIAFFPILLLYKYFFSQKNLLIYFGISLVTVLVYFAIRFGIGDTPFYKMIFVPIAELSFGERVVNMPAILSYYLTTFIFPNKLAIMQYWTVTSLDWQSFYLPILICLLLFVCLIGIGFRLKKGDDINKWYWFYFAWFVIGLLPLLHITPLNQTVSDRWFYFPMAGLLALIGIIIQQVSKPKRVGPIFISILIILIMLFSLRTIARNANWHDVRTLYSHDVHLTESYNLEAHLSNEYLGTNELDKARLHMERSVSLHPSDQSVSGLGYIYELQGNTEKAEEYYLASLTTQSYGSVFEHSPQVYINLGRYYLYIKKDPEQAKKFIEKGLDEYPDSFLLLILLVQYESQYGDIEKAKAAAQQVYEIMPNPQTQDLAQRLQRNERIDIPLWTFYPNRKP